MSDGRYWQSFHKKNLKLCRHCSTQIIRFKLVSGCPRSAALFRSLPEFIQKQLLLERPIDATGYGSKRKAPKDHKFLSLLSMFAFAKGFLGCLGTKLDLSRPKLNQTPFDEGKAMLHYSSPNWRPSASWRGWLRPQSTIWISQCLIILFNLIIWSYRIRIWIVFPQIAGSYRGSYFSKVGLLITEIAAAPSLPSSFVSLHADYRNRCRS